MDQLSMKNVGVKENTNYGSALEEKLGCKKNINQVSAFNKKCGRGQKRKKNLHEEKRKT